MKPYHPNPKSASNLPITDFPQSSGNRVAPRHVNEVHLVGNLVRTPEVRTTITGKKVANVSVVTAVSAKNKQFHRVVFWEELANRVESLKPGDFVEIHGYLQTRSWDDKDGNKRWSTEVVARSVITSGVERWPKTKNIHGLEVSDADIPF